MYSSALEESNPSQLSLSTTHRASMSTDARRHSRSSPLVGEKNKLCQEITDEFLICKICMDRLTAPKCLGCLHTFCEACIEKHVLAEYANKKYGDYREFHCPLCRKKTTLPIGGVKRLPDNFLVCNLSDMVTRSKPSGHGFCDICPSSRRSDAVSKCLECHKLLCPSCVELHRTTRVTREHALIDVDSEKDVFCKEHEEEVVRYYCEPCQVCVCVVCTFNTHREHEVASFGESASRHKAQIARLLNECKMRANELEGCLESLGKVEKEIKSTEQQVRDLAIEFVSEVRQRERQLVEELRSCFGEEALGFLSKRAEYQVLLDSLRSSCSLSEVVVRGKDLNFLLLKKSIQEKLRQSERIQPLLEVPSSLTKQVRFVPGGFELGWLQEDGEKRRAKYPSRRCSFSRRLKFVGSMDTQEAFTQTLDSAPLSIDKRCQTESNAFELSVAVQTLQALYTERDTQTKASYLKDKSVNTTIRMVQSAKVTKVLTATAVPVSREEVSIAVAMPPPKIEGPAEVQKVQEANGGQECKGLARQEAVDREIKSPEFFDALESSKSSKSSESQETPERSIKSPEFYDALDREVKSPTDTEGREEKKDGRRCHKHQHPHHKHHHTHKHHHKHHKHHHCHHKERKEARMATLEESGE